MAEQFSQTNKLGEMFVEQVRLKKTSEMFAFGIAKQFRSN